MRRTEGPWIYKEDTMGKIRKWRYVVEGSTFFSQQGIDAEGAKLVTNKPTQCEGKNKGKTNESSPEAQALVEAEAKMKKKLKTGYFLNKSDVQDRFQEPMLAKNYKDRKDKLKFPVGVELKLNGVRALYRGDGKLVSRRNEVFYTVPHILETIVKCFPRDIHLDGELFNAENRENLNRTTKLANVTRKDPTQEDLDESRDIIQYHIYDAYNFTSLDGEEIKPSTPLKDRRNAFLSLFHHMSPCKSVKSFLRAVKYEQCNSDEEVQEAAAGFVLEGHEGAIVRVLDAPYEFKRSANLLKVKSFLEAEFEILEMQEGKGNWAGYVKRVLCKLTPEMLATAIEKKGEDAQNYFASNIVGDREYLKDLWENKDSYVGKSATVSYQDISEFGYPQIPYVRAIRDYE